MDVSDHTISGFLAGYRNLCGKRHADRHDWLRGIEHPRRNDHTIGRAMHDLESTADRHWLKERGYADSSESAGGRTGCHSHAARCPTVLTLGQKAV